MPDNKLFDTSGSGSLAARYGFPNPEEDGFMQSRINNGNLHALKIHINRLFHQMHLCSEAEIKAYKNGFRSQLEQLFQQNNALSNRIASIKSVEKENIHEQIASCRAALGNMQQEKTMHESRQENVVVFNLLRSALVMLMGYLFVFYSSATLAAFFTQPRQEPLPAVIYNINALETAWDIGASVLIVVCAVPVLFFGMGYLLHNQLAVNRLTGFLRSLFLLGTVCLLHAVLCFEIASKLDTDGTTGYTLQDAAGDTNFWMMLVAGFIVYVVWNMLLEIVLQLQKRRYRHQQAIREQKNRIRESEQKLNRLDLEFKELTRQRQEIKDQIVKLEEALNKRYLNIPACEQLLLAYLSGWIEWMNYRRMPSHEVEAAQQSVHVFLSNIRNEFSPF